MSFESDAKQALYKEYAAEQDDAGASAHRSLLNEAVHTVVGTVWNGDSETRREVENYATQFVKSVPLFVGAPWAKAAATVAYGLDEVKSGESLGMQSAQLAAGMAKGYLTKTAFDHFGGKDWGFAKKGMAMGSVSRLIDTGLTPSNYFDSQGRFDIIGGARQAALNAGDAKALGVDVLTFGVASALPAAFGRSIFAENRVLSSSLTGVTVGFTSGTIGELQRQWHSGGEFDYGKVFRAGTIEAGVMGTAAAVGAKLTPEVRPTVERLEEHELRVRNATDGAEKGVPKVKELGGYNGFFLSEQAANAIKNNLVIDGKPVPLRWKAPEHMHVTEMFGTKQSEGATWAESAKGQVKEIRVIGHAVDAQGVEALRVSVDGRVERADGTPYHITRSVAEGRKASESGGVINKALAGEEPGRYSYTPLKPSEQFSVAFEPRWHQSDTATKELAKPKVERPQIPFDDLNPKMQVITALKATEPDYLTRLISTRTPEHRAGSFFDMTPEQLKAEIFRAKWEPYVPVDAQGKPIISGDARAYRATIDGGRLGMTEISAVPEKAQLYLIDPKGTGNWSVSTVGAFEPPTNQVTMIIGREPNETAWKVWTFHPGEPVHASALDSGILAKALGDAGVSAAADLPATGTGRRIRITRAQLEAINAQLPDGAKMTMAKIESEANLK